MILVMNLCSVSDSSDIDTEDNEDCERSAEPVLCPGLFNGSLVDIKTAIIMLVSFTTRPCPSCRSNEGLAGSLCFVLPWVELDSS